MDQPVALGGEYVLRDAGGRRLPPAEARVRDCPACGGYLHEDRLHVVATVGTGRGTATFYLCDPDCFGGWLRHLRGGGRRTLFWDED